jgi:hypothetical protein
MLYTLIPLLGIVLFSTSSRVLGQCESRLCRLRLPSDSTPTSFTDMQDAEQNGRCLMRCALQVLGNDNMDKDFGLWTSYSDDTLMALSCVQYSELRQCVLGCTLRTTLTVVNRCRDACETDCEVDCSNTGSCRSICNVTAQCRGTFCRRGCSIDINEGTPGALPSAPTAFSLRARNEFGRFDVVSANASQPAPEDQLFAFIFKLEMPEGAIHYVLQVHSVMYY